MEDDHQNKIRYSASIHSQPLQCTPSASRTFYNDNYNQHSPLHLPRHGLGSNWLYLDAVESRSAKNAADTKPLLFNGQTQRVKWWVKVMWWHPMDGKSTSPRQQLSGAHQNYKENSRKLQCWKDGKRICNVFCRRKYFNNNIGTKLD